ncbi:hypothetical protein IQ266_20290 [filamentous cyanobacterium LEGE 11480]|uniref:Uncharacterized protein n=1 Tax=Romeriopsis navalis LEGE 11480 TaxID=2777977 RepID=A0A928VQV6_9CYAN|nr:hypothetical protein [Romeriopsis navalis]MBE9032082.1 hypothetical protein [Romeriopsis navalis LEGE 11480]
MNKRSRFLLIATFSLAGVGLFIQIITAPYLAHRILAIALLLLGLDQTRMALVDLDNIAAVRTTNSETPALKHFERITWSTIGFELIGFYIAGIPLNHPLLNHHILLNHPWLAWGGGIVLFSQVWFNLLAGVQLDPNSNTPIQPFGIIDRAIVLLADCLGLGLIMSYANNIQPLVTAIGLAGMVGLYGLIKYGSTIKQFLIHSLNPSKS